VFRRVEARCDPDAMQGLYHCPGGMSANGNRDQGLCDNVPVYQQDGGGHVLLRQFAPASTIPGWEMEPYTSWKIVRARALTDCSGMQTPRPKDEPKPHAFFAGSVTRTGAKGCVPTAPGYSEGDGWIDLTANEVRGTIWVIAGAHYSKELGPSDHHGGPDAGEL
jgi:hypothetical protein